MNNPVFKSAVIALLGSTIIASTASAQSGSDTQITSVYERFREDFTAAGVRTGSFLFYPKVEAAAKYDSNIYATENNTVSDYVAIVKPSFALSSDWNSHSFRLFADAAIGRYADEGAEDYEDFSISANGRVDVSHGSSVSMGLTYDDKHEDRGSPDNTGTAYTTYSKLTATVGYKRDEGVFTFAADGKYEKSDFENVLSVATANSRDREKYTGSVRAGYNLNEDYEAFVRVTTTAVEYDDSRLAGGPLRDSDGWSAVGGAAFNIGGKTEGEVYVGYVKRDYDSASLDDISDIKFGASILWSATGLTSVKIAVDRDVTETIVSLDHDNSALTASQQASGILSTAYSVTVQHELQRNLLLQASASFNQMDFINMDRTDDVTKLGAGVRYLMNRNLSLNLNYDFDKRAASADNVPATYPLSLDYDRHAVIASLTAQW